MMSLYPELKNIKEAFSSISFPSASPQCTMIPNSCSCWCCHQQVYSLEIIHYLIYAPNFKFKILTVVNLLELVGDNTNKGAIDTFSKLRQQFKL